jgi:hypothetical protein
MIIQRMVKIVIPEDACELFSESPSDVFIESEIEYHVEVTIEQDLSGEYNLEQCLVYYIDIDSDNYVDITDYLSLADKEDIIEKVLDAEEYDEI